MISIIISKIGYSVIVNVIMVLLMVVGCLYIWDYMVNRDDGDDDSKE